MQFAHIDSNGSVEAATIIGLFSILIGIPPERNLTPGGITSFSNSVLLIIEIAGFSEKRKTTGFDGN